MCRVRHINALRQVTANSRIVTSHVAAPFCMLSNVGDLLDILEHANPDRYAGQRIFVVRRDEYVYLVPFVEDEHSVFLKTIIASRKATKQYLGEESDHED